MAAGKTNSKIAEDKLSNYDKIISSIPGVERKGASMPYTSLNGNMFSFIAADGTMALRLPATAREEFIKEHKTTLCEAHGVVLKEYVVVPEKLFMNPAKMKEYFLQSFEYAGTLKPKAAARPSKKAATRKPVKAAKESKSKSVGKRKAKTAMALKKKSKADS